MGRDTSPMRVTGVDLPEVTRGFTELFRRETGMAVDLFLDEEELRLPERLCQELFQIYREAPNNIRNHAKSNHVVVKLGQDDSRVWLVADDNGRGFEFAGKHGSEELDRLRLGPILIEQRARGVGGTLTVESNPVHGARLTIEIPYS